MLPSLLYIMPSIILKLSDFPAAGHDYLVSYKINLVAIH